MKSRQYKPVTKYHLLNDLTNRKFGRLVVTRLLGTAEDHNVYWECTCECGEVLHVRSYVLNHQQRGCKTCSTAPGARPMKHGMTRNGGSPEYKAWASIKKRCFLCTDRHFDDYGGRGITMCSAWKDDVIQFVTDVGHKPSSLHSIDRVDNNANYSCGKCEECIANKWTMNVRWATPQVQQRNRRTTVLLTANGRSAPLPQWADEMRVSQTLLHGRRRLGWTDEQILNTPLNTNMRRQQAKATRHA